MALLKLLSKAIALLCLGDQDSSDSIVIDHFSTPAQMPQQFAFVQFYVITTEVFISALLKTTVFKKGSQICTCIFKKKSGIYLDTVVFFFWGKITQFLEHVYTFEVQNSASYKVLQNKCDSYVTITSHSMLFFLNTIHNIFLPLICTKITRNLIYPIDT